jgi:hypothetical protein
LRRPGRLVSSSDPEISMSLNSSAIASFWASAKVFSSARWA